MNIPEEPIDVFNADDDREPADIFFSPEEQQRMLLTGQFQMDAVIPRPQPPEPEQ